MSAADKAKEIVQDLTGMWWPDADEDGLRDAAKAWRDFADDLEDVLSAANKSARGIIENNKGEAISAFDDPYWRRYYHDGHGWLKDMADGARDMAKALDKYADAVHKAVKQLEHELEIVGATIVAGTALAIFTAGISEAAAAAATAGIVELAGSLGVALSTEVATIAGTTLATAAIGGIESVTVDLAVTQPVAMATGESKGFNLDEVSDAATAGMVFGGAFGGGAGIARVAGEAGGFRALFDGISIPGARALPSELDGLGSGLRTSEQAATGDARSAARQAAGDDPQGTAENPKNKVQDDNTDPVDLVTGKMYLPQTDVTLPGALPLVFTRRVESGYRLGHWFGPSWSSTLDQHLAVDAEGVVFVTESGLLLSYPHPEPGASALPGHGSNRWPLTRVDGGYTVADPRAGRVWHFADQSEDRAVIEQIDDRNGNWLSFEYDTEGAPRAIASSGGYRLKITTTGERVTALHLAGAAPDGSDQEIKRYGYSPEGHLTDVVNSSGLPLRFRYDERGRVVSWTDTNNRSYTYEYDDRDRCTAESGSHGHMSLRLSYDETDPATGHRVTTTVTGEGHTRRYLINADSQVVSEIDPLGAATYFTRDRYNRLLSTTDPLGHTTTFRHDDSGNLLSVVRPDRREARAEYNDLGLPVQVTGTDGNTHRRAYDERGNRTSVTDPAAGTTHFVYTEAGHLTSVTDPLGHTTRVVCDRAGLPTEVTDPLGAVTRYTRDAFGRPSAITDPTGATTHLEWTVEGHLARRTAADGTTETWTYDGEGNCTSHTDPLGGVTRFEYTHFDLLSARTGPDGVRYEFAHDTELRLTEVTNPQGLTWSYAYDSAGHLVSESDFDDCTLTYSYDAAGRLATRTDVARQITFERDALGRVVTKTANGAVTTYAYDFTDQLAHAVGPNGITLELLRDRHGNIRSETVDGRTLTYDYDVLGRITGRITPTGARSTWTYDAAGNCTQLTANGRTIDFAYDEAGRELSRRIGSTVAVEHTFDSLGRLTGQSVTGPVGRRLQNRTYAYRSDGNLIGVDDHLSGSRRFDLDATGRVTAVHASDWTERYAYDEAGNQTDANWPAHHAGREATGARAYSGTRITAAGNVRYEHDAIGRVTLRQKTRLSRKPDTWRYEWDAEDRLTAVVTPDGTRWHYLYDPLDRRTAKVRLTRDGASVVERIDFTWDGATLVEQTTMSSELPNVVTLTWDHQGLRPLAQTERITAAAAPQEEIDSRFFAIVTDLVGSPRELIDEHGDIAWHTRSTLWGITAWASASTAYTPLRFPGQYYDAESGLHYNYFRTYDPDTARYLTPDPLGLAPAPNPVTYVHNPLTWCDPLGLAPYEPFYRVMSEKEFNRLGPKGEITPRGENFVTQEPDYVTGIAERFTRRGGRNALKYTHLVRYEMEPGTRDALIAAGRGSGDNIAAIREAFGIDLDEIGESVDFVHVKMERGGLNFGLRENSADVFNSNIQRSTHTLL
ncbi:RHS repeat-associated core domain-containing protein [Streptomyces sp. 1222.5]|uniref:RHS repeat-associated core domain-containing protein n=1 Tax=Streptomyces sp. 1222.5 TaxID=1881026 RepID=UPI003D7192AC